MADFASKVSANQVAQFFARFGKAAGSDDTAMWLLKRLLSDDVLMKQVVAFVRGRPCEVLDEIIDCWHDPQVPAGWSIFMNDRMTGRLTWGHFGIGLFPLHVNDDGTTLSEEERNALLHKSTLPSNVLDWLLPHMDKVPTEWHGKAILFAGTWFKNTRGERCWRFLAERESDGEWNWCEYVIGSPWTHSSKPFVAFLG